MAKKLARKKTVKGAAKKTARKSAKKKVKKSRKAGARPRPARASNAPRTPWFDAATHKPLISEYAQRLKGFIDTMADGQVNGAELRRQENRLIASMKDVEPLLARPVHEKVTRLLCELAAYDLMQALHGMHEARQQTVFKG